MLSAARPRAHSWARLSGALCARGGGMEGAGRDCVCEPGVVQASALGRIFTATCTAAAVLLPGLEEKRPAATVLASLKFLPNVVRTQPQGRVATARPSPPIPPLPGQRIRRTSASAPNAPLPFPVHAAQESRATLMSGALTEMIASRRKAAAAGEMMTAATDPTRAARFSAAPAWCATARGMRCACPQMRWTRRALVTIGKCPVCRGSSESIFFATRSRGVAAAAQSRRDWGMPRISPQKPMGCSACARHRPGRGRPNAPGGVSGAPELLRERQVALSVSASADVRACRPDAAR